MSEVGESVLMTVTPGPRHALSLWRRLCGATMWRHMALGHESCSSVHTGIIRKQASTSTHSSAAVSGGAARAAGEADGNGRVGDDSTDVGRSDDGDRSGVDGGASDSSEDSGRDGSMVSPGEKTATEISAGSQTSEAKKVSTSAAVRNYFEYKLSMEKAAADAAARRSGGGEGGGGGGGSATADGPTDGDVRQAVINMMNAFAHKARRA